MRSITKYTYIDYKYTSTVAMFGKGLCPPVAALLTLTLLQTHILITFISTLILSMPFHNMKIIKCHNSRQGTILLHAKRYVQVSTTTSTTKNRE